jgi:hypothetical protein
MVGVDLKNVVFFKRRLKIAKKMMNLKMNKMHERGKEFKHFRYIYY